MALSNILKLIYFALLQVVDALDQNSSAVVVTNIVEITLVRLDQRLCKYIEPPALPRIDVVFVFNTPEKACTPCETTLETLLKSSNKTLSYSHNNIKCSLRKKEGMITETNFTAMAASYVAIVFVNIFPSERNKLKNKGLLYQKVSDNTHTINTQYIVEILLYRQRTALWSIVLSKSPLRGSLKILTHDTT